MSKLTKEIRESLKEEAALWDAEISHESSEKVQELLNDTEPFKVPRPARQPVSLRMDPFDLSMIKRLARKKGVPDTQLMAMWLHERIEREKGFRASE